jgi:hypothetical protein
MNAFDRPVPTLAQQTQFTADAVNAFAEPQQVSDLVRQIETLRAQNAALVDELLMTRGFMTEDQLAAVERAIEAKTPMPELNEAQTECLTQISLARLAVYNPRTADWVWENKIATIRIFRELAGMDLVREILSDNSNAVYFEITQLGREIAGKL